MLVTVNKGAVGVAVIVVNTAASVAGLTALVDKFLELLINWLGVSVTVELVVVFVNVLVAGVVVVIVVVIVAVVLVVIVVVLVVLLLLLLVLLVGLLGLFLFAAFGLVIVVVGSWGGWSGRGCGSAGGSS